MKIDSNCIASITEANQNFSQVARLADRTGEVVIFKNNMPKYRLINVDADTDLELTEDEKVSVIAARILKRFRSAFLELAK